MSSMNSFSIGISGLMISQQSLNATAHNLTNAETTGYVRQQILTSDFTYRTIGYSSNAYQQVGLGTDMGIVRQVRNEFLDKSYRMEVGRQGFYQAQYESIQEVESIYGELEGVQYQNTLSDFWSALQEMAKTPNDIATREVFINTAVSFIERTDNIAKQISQYQDTLNTEITAKVNRINEIGQGITELNKLIRDIESGGVEQANDYRDARNNLLDELGQLINITYREDAKGVVTVMAEGMPFVTEDSYYKMQLTPVSDKSSMLKPTWKGHDIDVFDFSKECTTAANTNVGSLKGLLISRGDDAGKYTDIPKREDYASDEQFKHATKEYNIRINSSAIMASQAQFDQLVHGIVTTINDILCPNTEVTVSDGMTFPDDYEMVSGAGITLPDGTVLTDSTKIQILDEKNAPVGMDADKTKGEALFNRKGVDRYQKATTKVYSLDADGNKIPDPSDPTGFKTEDKTIYIYNEENPNDNYSLFTIGEIEVNQEILKDRSKLPLSSNSGSGEYDIKVCEKLGDAWNTPFSTLDPNSLTQLKFKDYYVAFVGGIANRGQTVNTVAANQEEMTNSIHNERLTVMGVSSDEELTNMIKFQHAYNASSRYINVVSEMLEHIIMRLA